MTLDDIPEGALVLLDANVLIYARRRMSEQCRRLLERCATGQLRGALTAIALAEFCHRRMMQEAQSTGLAASNPARALAGQPQTVMQLTQYAQDVRDLLAGQFNLLALEADDLAEALKLQQRYGLLTNDSLHLAAALRARVTALATSDPQFAAVQEIAVYRPDDVR